MIRIITTFVLLCCAFLRISFSQAFKCGTQVTQKDVERLGSLSVDAEFAHRVDAGDPIHIAISAHVIRRFNGSDGLTEDELMRAIDYVNQVYGPLTNMNFFLFGDINYVDSDKYFDFHADYEDGLVSVHNVPNTINVYFANTVVSFSGSDVCGYAYFPGSNRDYLFMRNSCTSDESTLAHELGHYFGLYHTHGKTNLGTTDELVDGTNCMTAGDDVCDTPADPNLLGNVSDDCKYTGTLVDRNGDAYDPNPANLMSYARKVCQDEFSQGQAERMSAVYQQYRTYLFGNHPLAWFHTQSRKICQGAVVSFSNQSIGAQSYEWIFEGGTPTTSTEAEPVVSYNTVGEFDVILTITTSDGITDTNLFTDYLSVKAESSSNITGKQGSFEEAAVAETIINDDGGITFALASGLASEGNQSIYMNFFEYNEVREEDYLIIGTLNSSVEKTFTLTFDYAYAYNSWSPLRCDGLAIVQRNPCGEWNTVWEKLGPDLKTTNRSSSFVAFEPSSGEWKTETISLNVPSDQDVIQIAFKSINGRSNNLYIDNYDIAPSGGGSFSFSITDVLTTKASCPDTNDGAVLVQTSRNGNFQYSADGVNYGTESIIGGLLPGNYTIYVKNEINQVNSVSVVIGYDHAYPLLPIIVRDNSVLSISEESGTTIQWFREDNVLPNETTPMLSISAAGSYRVEVTAGNCTVSSVPFDVKTIDPLLSANKIEATPQLYPNPATNQLEITLPLNLKGRVHLITVRDLTGKMVKTTSYVESIDVRHLDSGVYLLELSGKDVIVSSRFLKR